MSPGLTASETVKPAGTVMDGSPGSGALSSLRSAVKNNGRARVRKRANRENRPVADTFVSNALGIMWPSIIGIVRGASLMHLGEES